MMANLEKIEETIKKEIKEINETFKNIGIKIESRCDENSVYIKTPISSLIRAFLKEKGISHLIRENKRNNELIIDKYDLEIFKNLLKKSMRK